MDGNKCFNQGSTGVLAVLCSKPYEQVQHIPDGNRIAFACAEGDVKYDVWCFTWSKRLRAQSPHLVMSHGRLELYRDTPSQCQRRPGRWPDRAVKPHCSYEDPVTPCHSCCYERHRPGIYLAISTRFNNARVARKISLARLRARLVGRETRRARRITAVRRTITATSKISPRRYCLVNAL